MERKAGLRQGDAPVLPSSSDTAEQHWSGVEAALSCANERLRNACCRPTNPDAGPCPSAFSPPLNAMATGNTRALRLAKTWPATWGSSSNGTEKLGSVLIQIGRASC